MVFGELIPKYFAREFPDKFVLITAIPIRLVSYLIYPLVVVTSAISNYLVATANIKEEEMDLEN